MRVVPILVLLPLFAATPSFGQSQCQANVQAVRQGENQVLVALRNEWRTYDTALNNRLIDCSTSSGNNPKAYQACAETAQKTHMDQVAGVEKRINQVRSDADNDVDLINAGPCPWSPEQITRMVGQLGQAIGQVEQGAAQIISATKGKGAGTPAATDTRPAAESPAAEPSATGSKDSADAGDAAGQDAATKQGQVPAAPQSQSPAPKSTGQQPPAKPTQ